MPENDNYSVFLDSNIIYNAGKKAMSGSLFKYKTHYYEMTHLANVSMIRESLINRTYRPSPGRKFRINERGKERFITSNTMIDKTINHVICDEFLTPLLSKYLIYDNGASQKGKGVSFHRKRFKVHLLKYYAHHKTNKGYILLVDFSGYYANIPHDKCIEMLDSFIDKTTRDCYDTRLLKWLIRLIFKTFRVDVSRFSDEEIELMKTSKVDQMLNNGVNASLLTGKKFLEKGVDIGNQISQNIGILYPHRIDNYAKIVRGMKYYGRYTDDFYVMSDNKEELKSVLEGFRRIAEEYGLIINERKTRIVKLSSFYRHLQDGYSLTHTGRIIYKINPKSVARERKKLKAYKRLLDRGVLTFFEIENSFKSWLGSNWKRMSHKQIYEMNSLFIKLFGRRTQWLKKGYSRLRWLMEHPSMDSSSTATTSSPRRRSRRRRLPVS